MIIKSNQEEKEMRKVIKSKEKRKKKLQKALAVLLAMALLMTTMSLGVFASDDEPAGDADVYAYTPEVEVDGDNSYDVAPDYGAYYDEPKYNGDKSNSEYYEKNCEECEYEKYVPIAQAGYIGIAPMSLQNAYMGIQIRIPGAGYYPVGQASLFQNTVALPYFSPCALNDFMNSSFWDTVPDFDWADWRIGYWTLGFDLSREAGHYLHFSSQQVLDGTEIYFRMPQSLIDEHDVCFDTWNWSSVPIFRFYLEPIPTVDKTHMPNLIIAGDELTYRIRVDNNTGTEMNPRWNGACLPLSCGVRDPICCRYIDALRLVDDLSELLGEYFKFAENEDYPELSQPIFTIVSGSPAPALGTPVFNAQDSTIELDIFHMPIDSYFYLYFTATVLEHAIGEEFTNNVELETYRGTPLTRPLPGPPGSRPPGNLPAGDGNTSGSSSTTLTVFEPILSIEKLVNGGDLLNKTSANITNTIVYTIRVTNECENYTLPEGFKMVDDLSRLIDTFLDEFDYDTNITVTGGTFESLEYGVLTVMLGELAPGASVEIRIEVYLVEGLTLNGQSFVNTASVRNPSGSQTYRIIRDEDGYEIDRFPLTDTATVTLPGGDPDPEEPNNNNNGNGDSGETPIPPVQTPPAQTPPREAPPATPIDEDGVPLGEWTWNEYEETWELDEDNVPLGVVNIPQTGLSGNLMSWMFLVASLMVIAALMTRKRDEDRLQEQGLGLF